MARKTHFKIAASVIAVTIATAGISTVTSFTFVPEAQAFSIKKVAKKTYKKARKTVKKVKRVTKRKARIVNETFRDTSTLKSMPGAVGHAWKQMGKGAYKYTKRGVKKTATSAKGAGILAYTEAKRAGRHIGKAAGSYRKCLTRGCGRIGDLPIGAGIHDHRRPKAINIHDHRRPKGNNVHDHRIPKGTNIHDHRRPTGIKVHDHRRPTGIKVHDHRRRTGIKVSVTRR